MEEQDRYGNSLSFVIAVNNEEVFRKNVLASPVFRSGHRHELLVRRGFSSAGVAYNDAISVASNDLIVFMHQDIYLPDGWDENLRKSIAWLETMGEEWGVLGSFGISLEGLPVGHVYSNGLGKELGFPQSPVRVQSLDEIVLVFRKSSGLRFDPMLPYFHLYGTDICLESKRKGLGNYAIGNFCIHNSRPIHRLPTEFWRCAGYLQEKWRQELPIKTCCVLIPTSSTIMFLQRIRSWISSYRRGFGEREETRVPDPAVLLSAERRDRLGGTVGNAMEKRRV